MGAGRPLKFNSVSELENEIEKYFNHCDKRTKTVILKGGKGKPDELAEVPHPKPYTVAGLAAFLGIDRKTLLNYENYEDEEGEQFFPTIKKAKAKIEANLIERGLDGSSNATMVIFLSKCNYGYDDSVKDKPPTKINIHIVRKDGKKKKKK